MTGRTGEGDTDDSYDAVVPRSGAKPGLLRRSTARLEGDYAAALRAPCECDDYVGHTCGKHQRVRDLEHALCARRGISLRTLWSRGAGRKDRGGDGPDPGAAPSGANLKR